MAMIGGLLLSPFLFILQNCNNVNALRPEMLAVELKVEDDESCLGTCHPRNQARHQGEFTMALQDVQAVGYGSYFITETSCQTGPLGSDSMVSVVPRLDEENPINKSNLLVSVEPRKLAHLHGDRLQICVSENGEGRCLCRLEPAAPPSNGRMLPALQQTFARVSHNKMQDVEAKLLTLSYDCPERFPIDLVVLLLIIFFVALLLVLVHTARSIWRVAFADSREAGPPSIEIEDSALQIPSPSMTLKAGALQALRLTTLMTSLEAVVLNQIRSQSDERIVLCVILWPCIFGLLGLWRSFRSMCQVQLAHAVLECGVCLTQPANAQLYDLCTAIGTLMLAICVAAALVQNGFYTCFVMIFGLFLGPSLSILGELQKARGQDTALRETEERFRIKGLLRLFQTAASDEPVPMTKVEAKFVEGKVKTLPFSALVTAGRSDSMNLDEIEDEGPEAPGHCNAFNLLDLSWQPQALFHLTGSFAGFFTLPLLFLAGGVLLAFSIFQAGAYFCTPASLANLSLANGELGMFGFRPWIREYEVKLDLSFADAFVVATAENASIAHLKGSKDESQTVYGTVELRNMLAPRMSGVNVKGLRETEESYSVLFTPVATLPISMKISSGNYTKCVPWSEIPGSVLALPPDLGALTVEVALTDFELGIPQPCRANITSKKVYTEFCDYEQHSTDFACRNGGNISSCKRSCQTSCSHDPHCLASFAAKHGCYRAKRPASKSCDEDFDAQHANDRHWLPRESMKGRLCPVGGETRCAEVMALNKEWKLRFENVQPEWLNELAGLKLGLSLAGGSQTFDSNEEIVQLRLGEPQVLAVLVNIIAYRWNGERISLDVAAVVNEESGVALTLKRYQPQYLRNMTMFFAPLLSDSYFSPSWNATPVEIVETHDARRVFEKKCHESAFLQTRFNVCGNDLGWQTKIAKTSLQVWKPDATLIFFRTETLKEAPFFSSQKSLKPQRVTIVYENSESPAFWAIPENQCVFHVLEVDEVEKRGIPADDAEAAAESARIALGSTPAALCIYVSRKCDAIQMISPIPMPFPMSLFKLNPRNKIEGLPEIGSFKVINVTAEAFALMYVNEVNSKAVTTRPAHVFSSIFAPLLQCYRARGPPWPEWVEPESWEADLEGRDRVWSGWKMDPDAVAIKVQHVEVVQMPVVVEMKDILHGMTSSSSQADDELIRDMCDFLFKPANCRRRPAEMGDLDRIQETVMAGAFSTGNGDVLQLVEKHCFKFRQMSASIQASTVSLAWQNVKTHFNGLQLLNASLRSGDTDFARALLEFSTSSECSECAETVKHLFQQEGHSWPLNFQRFTLYMNENYKTLLDTRGQNPTAPWICTEELWIGRPIGHYVPFHCDDSCAFALREFLHQFATCSTAFTSLVIDLLLDAAGVEELIETLKSELPKVLDLSVVPDGAQKLVQKVAVLEELPNLQILKLRIRASSYGGDKVKVVEFAKDLIQKAPTKLTEVDLQVDEYGFKGDGAAPTAMANMIGALPSLKRFRVGMNSDVIFISEAKPALASFVAAVTANTSHTKLESFSFMCPSISGDLRNEYERFGKALASMPELREINMTWCRWEDSDKDAFLPHFITKKPATLRKLLLKGARLRDHDLQTVSKIIEKQPLEVIDISTNRGVSDQGLHHISEALGNLQKLTPAVPCHLREVYALAA
eukprot:symbB.v1.2.019029.t1/scaffold1541.1/size112753/11